MPISYQQDQQQDPNRLKENPGKAMDHQENPADAPVQELEEDTSNNISDENDEVDVDPESVDKSESVNKYNFIFYFLYKFKYEDSRDEGIFSSLF